MKKITLLVAGCISMLIAFSQTKKGDKMVGVGIGSISYTNSDSKTTYSNTPTIYNSDGTSFSISINPNVAWFVNDNLAIGGGVSISFYSSKSNSSNTSSTTTSESKSTQPSFYIGPLARYYLAAAPKECRLHKLISSMVSMVVKAKVKPAQAHQVKPLRIPKATGIQVPHSAMSILSPLMLAFMVPLALTMEAAKPNMSTGLLPVLVMIIPANTQDSIFR